MFRPVIWLLLVIVALVSLGLALQNACADPPTGEDVKSLFEVKYREWVKSRQKAISPRSDIDLSIYFDNNEAFQEIVKLGIPAVPYIFDRLKDDHMLGHALYRITKWKYHIKRVGRKPAEYVWFVEEFPDIRQKGCPPDSTELWLRWWKEGIKEVPQRFEKLYLEWKDLKQLGKEKEAKVIYQKITDLGIVALSSMVEKAKQGDSDLIPAISELTDGAIRKRAGASECLEWWKNNKKKWAIPGPTTR